MIEPLQKDDQLLNDIQTTRDSDNSFRVWWLGQSGFLIQHLGFHLLFDPYLSDSLTEKYAQTDKPHVRMTKLVVDPAKLDFVDCVTSSHNHTDHLDRETLLSLHGVNSQLRILVPEANLDFAAKRLGLERGRLDGLCEADWTTVGPMRIKAVPAAHETIERDDKGHPLCIGFVCELGEYTIYHSGDTLRYPSQVEILKRYEIDLALLPINGRAPERRVAGNLNGCEAAELAFEIGAKCVIPCHYEMFEFNTATPDSFIQRCEELKQGFAVLRCGESWSPK